MYEYELSTECCTSDDGGRFNHRARNIIAIGHIVAPPSSASLEKMFKRELNQTNYLIVLINKRLIIQTTINYTTALLKSRAVLSEPILVVKK
ncbi:hypothetical protein [Piscirickettsia salmonis]|uniref:hypothetical protein n=1 Tax=Piscirickettsia salmonis TaxID=1238 RepID=UPI00094AB222